MLAFLAYAIPILAGLVGGIVGLTLRSVHRKSNRPESEQIETPDAEVSQPLLHRLAGLDPEHVVPKGWAWDPAKIRELELDVFGQETTWLHPIPGEPEYADFLTFNPHWPPDIVLPVEYRGEHRWSYEKQQIWAAERRKGASWGEAVRIAQGEEATVQQNTRREIEQSIDHKILADIASAYDHQVREIAAVPDLSLGQQVAHDFTNGIVHVRCQNCDHVKAFTRQGLREHAGKGLLCPVCEQETRARGSISRGKPWSAG